MQAAPAIAQGALDESDLLAMEAVDLILAIWGTPSPGWSMRLLQLGLQRAAVCRRRLPSRGQHWTSRIRWPWRR